MKHRISSFLIAILSIFLPFLTQAVPDPAKPVPGAERLDLYLPLLKNKGVAVFANHTSRVGNTNIVDTLMKLGVDIKVVFGPEHGFRGDVERGQKVGNYTDERTGIPVVSLYGGKRAPTEADLKGVDIMLFDIQDVGARFYTYISSLEEYINSAMAFGKMLVVLDRPNPNGFYIDGPVLQPTYRSFIGMQPIPVVYGMTMGEYAKMLVGEKWVNKGKPGRYAFVLRVIPCANYTHASVYHLPVAPSPNLPDMASIYAYPSTCFFEGTVISEGRGTDKPFVLFGHPDLPDTLTSFTPTRKFGAAAPKHMNKTCYGWEWEGTADEIRASTRGRLQLKWLLQAYRFYPEKDSFFNATKSAKGTTYFFNSLAGNKELMEQIRQGKSEEAIRQSWQPALTKFKAIRKKYLLYP